MNELMAALEQFDAAEANLTKLERLWSEIEKRIPNGISFGSDPEYHDYRLSFEAVLPALPAVEGWKPVIELCDLNDIAQNRLDYAELGEPAAEIQYEESLSEPGRQLQTYRHRFNRARRALVRDALSDLIDTVDNDLHAVAREAQSSPASKLTGNEWEALCEHVKQIGTLIGSGPKPPRWSDLLRHLHFGEAQDFRDVRDHDWPAVKPALRKNMHGEDDPVPVAVSDLGILVRARPSGVVTTELNWEQLSSDQFERLIFSLISSESGYENPEWLMRTNAPDRGRDLSVTRAIVDGLTGTRRERVILQCKHWLSRSVSLSDVTEVKEQMSLWRDPPVDVLVIATTGRFTTDAVQWIEQHNNTGIRPRIEMWPESHLELLLSARPGLIAEYALRR